MGLLETLEYCFSKEHFANWNGRASRSEFLWFQLINFFFGIIFFSGLVFLYVMNLEELDIFGIVIFTVVGIVSLFLGIGATIASITVMGRRFHDLNLSAWFMLTTMIPFVGFLMSLVCAFGPSHQGASKFEVVKD